jgi:hypothetical protein
MNKCFSCPTERELIPTEMDGEIVYLCPFCYCAYMDNIRLRNPTPSGHTQGDML